MDWISILVTVTITACLIPLVDLASIYYLSKKFFGINIFERFKDKIGWYVHLEQYDELGKQKINISIPINEISGNTQSKLLAIKLDMIQARLDEANKTIERLKKRGR